MRDIDALKQRLDIDGKFRKLFANVSNIREAVNIAKEHGFNISEEDVEKDQVLTDETLEAVAGGKKKDSTTNTYNHYID